MDGGGGRAFGQGGLFGLLVYPALVPSGRRMFSLWMWDNDIYCLFILFSFLNPSASSAFPSADPPG